MYRFDLDNKRRYGALMEIGSKTLSVFMLLYQHEYGITMADEKVSTEFSKLFQLYKLVYLTPPSEKLLALARERAREKEKVLVERYLR